MTNSLRLLILALLLPLLVGFVPSNRATLEACRAATPKGPARLKAVWNGAPGVLEVSVPGRHRFVGEDGKVLADPGPVVGPERDQGAALWRLLDFYSPLSAADLADLLVISGVDPDRRGWVRLEREGDHRGLTLGALGETEPGLPQVWIDQATRRVVAARAADGSLATASPRTVNGWPSWLRVGGVSLEIVGAPEPLKAPKGDPLGPWRQLLPPPPDSATAR